MKTPPSSSVNLCLAVAVAAVLILSLVPSSHGFGSGATLALSDSSSTVCAVVASESTRRIECYRQGQVVPIAPNVSFSSISGGRNYFCGIRSSNSNLLCWNTSSSFERRRLYNDSSVPLENLAVGDTHVCATAVGDGTVRCWRTGNTFQIVSGSDQFASISSGSGFSCGILKNGSRVRCWGDTNVSEQIENSFRNISMLSLVAGGSHVCGLNLTGFLVCRGSNGSGQFDIPQGGAFEYSGLALGAEHGCAIRESNGSVVCWGGNGQFSVSNVTEGVSFEVIVSGSNFVCGLTTNNLTVVCWGPGWSNGSRFELPLPRVLPGPCVQSSCGECGSFGVVYKGKLTDGREVAIKRGETGSKMKKFQEKESAFESELAFLSRLHHKHLVGLVGFCEEKDERLLVYEYMKNGALYDHLHDKNNVEKESSVLNNWKMRIKIALDASRGIEYLHNYAVPSIIHRDIKSSNILLDATWTARVSDFGLSLMSPEPDRDHRPMKAAGTVGYIDPEYYGLNVLTAKSDVYGLGVVLLELLTGKRAIFKYGEDGGTPLSVVDFAVPSILAGELVKLLDPRVEPPNVTESEAVELVAYTAIHCVNLEGKDRPTMADIVSNLERALAICESSHDSISSGTISVVSE
ncbi:Putative serine/threonine-protein kinase-like protein CCR3 [Glycine soja]|uniref:non-specific serine/threonine protein kinase n=1 Tax=Glycine soja TaxID=3848 RepID=A0A0B2RV97_GLYSO|nr:Putative serine/threonine-protein kinase-like protein CCR3 [Glycine soja]